MQKDNKPRQDHRPGGKRLWLPVIALAGFIGFLLIYEHRAHIPTNAIFFLGFLLFCGVMHTFMHGGHGGHGWTRRPSVAFHSLSISLQSAI